MPAQHADYLRRRLAATDVDDAIARCRLAYKHGWLADDAEEQQRIVEVRGYRDWQRFVTERATALGRYQQSHVAALEVLLRTENVTRPEDRLQLAVPVMLETMAADGELRAFNWSYQHPDGLLASLVGEMEEILSRNLDAAIVADALAALASLAPRLSFATLEALMVLPIVSALEGRECDAHSPTSAQLQLLQADADTTALIEDALSLLARGDIGQLARKVDRYKEAYGGEASQAAERIAEAQASSAERKIGAQRLASISADGGARLRVLGHQVETLLSYDHIEDALRDAVFDGLEDYWLRGLVAEGLHSLGRLPSPHPMDYPQHQGLKRAAVEWLGLAV